MDNTFPYNVVPWLPSILFVMLVAFPFLVWSINMILGLVNPILPYVSDLGILPPAASIFTLVLGALGCFLLLFVALRDRFSRNLMNTSESCPGPVKRANNSLYSGLVMTFGVVAIGSFRNNEIPFIQMCHNLFATVTFIMFPVDCFLEIRISYVLPEHENMIYWRRIILVLSLIFVPLCVIPGFISFYVNADAFWDKDIRLFWSSKDAGYALHLTATFFEWLLIFLMATYFLTFRPLFRAPHNKLMNV